MNKILEIGKKFFLIRGIYTGFLIIFIIVWSKITYSFLNLELIYVLLPLAFAFIFLAVISPPIAVALFFMSNYLIGSLSTKFYPRLSFLSVIAFVLVVTLFYLRWKEGVLKNFFKERKIQFYAIIGLTIFFLIGFFTTIFMGNGVLLGFKGLFSLFIQSARHSSKLLHYEMITHWLTFIILGALACMNMKDLKKFILAFVFLVIVQPLSMSLSFFPEFFKRIYLACEPLGLAVMQINRAHMGYLNAISSNIAFASSMYYKKGYKKAIFIFWWLLTAALAFLSGTKGVMIALIGGMFIVLFFYKKEALKRITIMFAFLIFLIALFGVSIIPCGTVKKYQDINHSVITRLNEMSRVNEMRKADIHSYLLGQGFGASNKKFEGGKLVPSSSSLNLFLDILADTGIVGLALFLSSVFILMIAMFRALKINAADDKRIMIAVFFIVSIILIFRVNNATGTYEEDLLALLIGVMIGSAKTAAAEKKY